MINMQLVSRPYPNTNTISVGITISLKSLLTVGHQILINLNHPNYLTALMQKLHHAQIIGYELSYTGLKTKRGVNRIRILSLYIQSHLLLLIYHTILSLLLAIITINSYTSLVNLL